MKNKYIVRSRISEKKFRQICRLFCLDIEAVKVAQLSGVSRPSVNKIFNALRIRIAEFCDQDSPLGTGDIELDESYFGPRRVRGKRGRGALKKIPVFGMLKRNGKVYTQVVKNVSRADLMPIIAAHADLDSTLLTDSFRSYDGLVDYGFKQHFRVKHSDNQFADGTNHINGIENFWGLCKVRLSRFRSIHSHKFYYHLKECEFRFNMRNQNLYSELLKICRNHPLKLS